MTNVDLVKELYANFAAGNVPAALAVFDPAIEWLECKGMPFVKDDGVSIGPEAVVANVFMQLPVYFDGFNIEVTDVFSAGDKIAMMGFYHGTNKATGHPFKANATHIWTIKNSKLTHFFQAVDTATIMS
ncbi:MAG: nuclear transport factor 2 family protein [Chitinophagaceae bacterium]